MAVEVGSMLTGKVVRIMPFGAFVELEGGTVGLVHISEVAQTYVNDINEHLKQGDTVKVCVVKIDDSGKISLSIKKAAQAVRKVREPVDRNAKREPVRPAADWDWGKRSEENLSFEDKLSKFKQASDENMQAIRRSNDSKRSGGYRRGGGSY